MASSGPPKDDISRKPRLAVVQASWKHFKSLWTTKFTLALLSGQLVSLCITCTNVSTQELVNRRWNNSTTQSFFLYFALFVVFAPYTLYRYGVGGWGKMVKRDGWKYFILAACDVEGNFLVVKAYQYTSLLSCILLDVWTVPVCLIFAWVYMRPRYYWTQIWGIIVCIGGLGLLVLSDKATQKDRPGVNPVMGDIFVLLGASLYGFANATEEFFVRRSPFHEVIGMLGMWGVLISGAQAAGLEHNSWMVSNWDGPVIGLLFAYTGAMFILYTVSPWIFRVASSTFFNISILTSDFYGLLFGLALFRYQPYWLYFVAFAVVIVGIVIHLWPQTPEEQDEPEPPIPLSVQRRDQGGDTEGS